MTCKSCSFTKGRKITYQRDDCGPDKASADMQGCLIEMKAHVPQYQHLVDQGAKKVIQLMKRWLIWARYDPDEADILRAKAQVGRKIDAD